MTPPTVMGIDPSLTGTGIAVNGLLMTIAPRVTGNQRLGLIYRNICEWLDEHQPSLVVIEDLPKHAHGAGLTGMAHGVIRLALEQRSDDTRMVAIAPATVKKFATGKGNATKADMRMALYVRTRLDLRDDNQVDAEWLRHLGLHLINHPERLPLPKAHLEALKGITP